MFRITLVSWIVQQNNGAAAFQTVPHIHYHVIPKTAGPFPPVEPPAVIPQARGPHSPTSCASTGRLHPFTSPSCRFLTGDQATARSSLLTTAGAEVGSLAPSPHDVTSIRATLVPLLSEPPP